MFAVVVIKDEDYELVHTGEGTCRSLSITSGHSARGIYDTWEEALVVLESFEEYFKCKYAIVPASRVASVEVEFITKWIPLDEVVAEEDMDDEWYCDDPYCCGNGYEEETEEGSWS